ncbi:MAG: 50S ribosomal protein L4 [Desulfobacterales bacterium CG23_combo_of_CG06-09_8_20_14_all_51_8]|nr:MAG: 50S ribosomal protein L4 [Desulfobacterales bacterium CG23_combo_of_CG06-09_8_20_14_all_51_8]
MAVIEVKNIRGEKVSEVEMPDSVFNIEPKKCVLHEVVLMQLAAKRSGTAAVKRRSDVKGSNVKLFRQKGTGRARRGDIKSPLLRGGGVIFGPDPRSYAMKVHKKVKRLALKMALSSKLKEDMITVLDAFALDEIKTKSVIAILKTLKLENPLIVVDVENEALELSSRNIPGVKVLRVEGLNVYDILKHKNLVLLETAIKTIEGRLAA